MSADVLRRAAALMRERAEAAVDGGGGWWGVEPVTRALEETFSPPAARTDAEHIASWHPAVALAVADCIDAALCYFDPDEFSEAEREMHDSLLTLARTYLNESA